MSVLIWIIIWLVAITVLAYRYAKLRVWTITLLLLLIVTSLLSRASDTTLTVIWIIFAAIFIVLNILPLRRWLLTRHIIQLFRRVMPTLSDTERAALEAGDIGWESALFSGCPDWKQLKQVPAPQLNSEEQAFMRGPVTELCQCVDTWKLNETMQMPTEIIKFLAKAGFFGLIIPKRYGGLEFSAFAHSQILACVSSVSASIATMIAVPNSLGPAELLLQYGTEQQKDYFLPRLAKGEEIPCFALTSPVAGSDAGSITDHGVLCEAEFEGKQQLCIRLNFSKRYITLAPIATLIGLAFKLYDPENLLGDQFELGITCALIPRGISGIEIGRRHYPLHSAFPNGPIQGHDVLIPLSYVIGGREQVGRGWRMLMECLAAGRGISLPSITSGPAEAIVLLTGSYVRIRRQFNTYIGKFGGIAEVLGCMGAQAYMMKATRIFTANQLDQGKKSAVAAAITKYSVTEMARQVGNSAMDIHGGKGICMGPNNYLAQGYTEIPIGITVEGANILTRSLMIFGQGAIRCHPFLLKEILAAQDKNQKRGLIKFGENFFAHLGFIASNKVRAFILGLTDGRGSKAPRGPLRRYYQKFTRLSSALAFMADIAMITLGSTLKRREELSARLGDILSRLYMGSAVLSYYEENHGVKASPQIAIVHWCCQTLCYEIECIIDDFIRNLPNRLVRLMLRPVVFPRGRYLRRPEDDLTREIAYLLMQPNKVRQQLAGSLYQEKNKSWLAKLEMVMQRAIVAEPLEKKIIKAKRQGTIVGKTFEELITAAVNKNVINQQEAAELLEINKLRMEIIHVDDFPQSYFDHKLKE